jgi:hypothetical protein
LIPLRNLEGFRIALVVKGMKGVGGGVMKGIGGKKGGGCFGGFFWGIFIGRGFY